MGKTIRSFNASENVNDLINESGIKKGELSNWINDKIEKGLIYEKQPNRPKQEIKMVEKVRVRY